MKGIISAGRFFNERSVVPPQEPSRPHHAEDQQYKLSHYISILLREKESKFSGDLGESWFDYVVNTNKL